MDDLNGGAGERARTAQAGGVKPLGHVGANFGKAQRAKQARAGDALLERLKLWALKNGEQFGLAAQNDLQQFFLIRVGVAQEANFFKQLDAHQVSFVDQENCGATLLLRLEKHLVESGEATRLARGSAANFVFFEDGLEQLGRSESRIDEERGDEAAAAFGFFGENLQSGVKKSCLASADGPGDDGETFALQNALKKNFERSAVWVGQMKKSGVRGETERFFFELVKSRIQIDLPRVPNSYVEVRNEPLNKLTQVQREHFSYQTANSTTNTRGRIKRIAFSRFGAYSRRNGEIEKRFFARRAENRSHQKPSFFVRAPIVRCKKSILRDAKSSRRAGDILGYSGNAVALRADATGDSILLR